MTFLPIVERELRVAARRRTTFHVRFLAAAGTAVVVGMFLAAQHLPGGLAPSGKVLFGFLVFVQFVVALLSGPLLTADCLSRERREGTLGFLFLTDLTGFDVVAGKFAALGLVPLHGLLAVFPITAITVLLGGVSGDEFWRAHAVVLNSVFLSMATGLWISSVVTDERQAVALTLGTLATLVFAPLLLARICNSIPLNWASTYLPCISPLGALSLAYQSPGGGTRVGFGSALLYQHALGWILLLIAASIVRASWRQEPIHPAQVQNPETEASRTPHAAQPPARSPNRREQRLRRAGPLAIVAWRGSWIRRAVPWVTGLSLTLGLVFFVVTARVSPPLVAVETAMLTLAFGLYTLKFLLVVHAAYFLNDMCRTGAMELILTTPVSSHSLREGHFTAMREMFLRPVLLLGFVQIGLGLAGRWIAGGNWPNQTTLVIATIVPPIFGVLVHLADFLAVAYHISTHSLRYDRPSKAIARTTVTVLALPLVFCSWGRILVDLIVVGQHARSLDRFRDLAHGWFFPTAISRAFSAPRHE